MLSAAVISQGVRSVASMLSPEKNPCRVRCEGASENWYRFDPYVSKVIPSPMKTQLVSPVKVAQTAARAMNDEGLHRNSLFSSPAPMAPRPVAFAHEQDAPAPINSYGQPAMATKPAPAQQTAENAQTHYAVVYFKHDSCSFIAPFRVKEGDHVIVEGDRGVDLGVIRSLTTVTPDYNVPRKIVRRATSRDMEAFEEKQRKEQATTANVSEIAASLSLNISVVDTEFQFDNNKLTVFFSSADRDHIDFRKLQRGLFREHRCRIWLSNMAEVEYKAMLQERRRSR